MDYLATLYRAAQLYAHNAHNLAKGQTFFEDHEFLGESYGAYEEAYDSVVERMIGLGITVDLIALQTEAATMVSAWGPCEDNTACFGKLTEVERMLCAEIERIQDNYTGGTQNLLQGLADESEVRQYKLQRRTS